jgi:MFS family permease
LVLALSMVLQPVLRDPWAAAGLMGLLMMGHSLAFPTAGALTSRIAPVEQQGSIMGLLMAQNAGGRIVAPPLFGLIYERAGHDTPWYAGAILVLLALPAALQLIGLARKPAG